MEQTPTVPGAVPVSIPGGEAKIACSGTRASNFCRSSSLSVKITS